MAASKARVALQAAYDRFASAFLVPLVTGGEMEVGDPIGPGAIDHFVDAVPSDPDVSSRIWSALRVRIADVYEGTPRWSPGPDETRIAAALHNVVYMTHPDLDRALGRRAKARVARWTRRMLDAVGPPATVEAAVLRHAVVGRFDELSRRDTTVSTWAYRYRFPGRLPPKRLVAMGRLRRVRTETSLTRFADLSFDATTDELLVEVVRRTPLTAALRPTLPRPPFRWRPEVVDVLQDVSLCRLATYEWTAVWPHVPRIGGSALAALSGAPLDSHRLAFVLCFHYNLLLTFAHVAGTQAAERLTVKPNPSPEESLFYGTLFSAFQGADLLNAPPLPVPASERAEILQSLATGARPEHLEQGRALVETASRGVAS